MVNINNAQAKLEEFGLETLTLRVSLVTNCVMLRTGRLANGLLLLTLTAALSACGPQPTPAAQENKAYQCQVFTNAADFAEAAQNSQDQACLVLDSNAANLDAVSSKAKTDESGTAETIIWLRPFRFYPPFSPNPDEAVERGQQEGPKGTIGQEEGPKGTIGSRRPDSAT